MANGPQACPLVQMASARAAQAVSTSLLPLGSAAASAVVVLPSAPEPEAPPDKVGASALPPATPPDPVGAPPVPPEAPPAPIGVPPEPALTSLDDPASIETAPPAPAFVAPPLPPLLPGLPDEPLQDANPIEIRDQTTISLMTMPPSCESSVAIHVDEWRPASARKQACAIKLAA